MALAAIHGIALERRVRPVNTHLLYHCRRGNEGNDWSGKKTPRRHDSEAWYGMFSAFMSPISALSRTLHTIK